MATALLGLLVGLASPASAAFIRLDPQGAAGPGPVVFTVFLEGQDAAVDSATVKLHFLDEASIGTLEAANTGNPFQPGATSISTTSCNDAATVCWVGGGFTDVIPPIDSASIQLGTLTLSTVGPSISIVVSSESGWSNPAGAFMLLDNVGATVATLPEPRTLAIIALALFALAVLGRAHRARR